jgi:hypothetical protein
MLAGMLVGAALLPAFAKPAPPPGPMPPGPGPHGPAALFALVDANGDGRASALHRVRP